MPPKQQIWYAQSLEKMRFRMFYIISQRKFLFVGWSSFWTSSDSQKFENQELEDLLNENSYQIQSELAQAIGVT